MTPLDPITQRAREQWEAWFDDDGNPRLSRAIMVSQIAAAIQSEKALAYETAAKVAEQAGICQCRTGDSRDPHGYGQEHWGDCPQSIAQAIRLLGEGKEGGKMIREECCSDGKTRRVLPVSAVWWRTVNRGDGLTRFEVLAEIDGKWRLLGQELQHPDSNCSHICEALGIAGRPVSP